MENQIDIAKITDLKTIKSLAFDQLVILEQTKNNLALINQQILKIQTSVVDDTKCLNTP